MLDIFQFEYLMAHLQEVLDPLSIMSEVLKEKQIAKNLPKGKKVGSGFLAGFSAASHASLSILNYFRQTTMRHSIIHFLIFLRWKQLTSS